MSLEKHDLAKDPPTRELLERLVTDANVREVLNPRSPAYKERGLADREVSASEAIDLILKDSNLMKRPLVVSGKKFVFGWKPDEYREKLGAG